LLQQMGDQSSRLVFTFNRIERRRGSKLGFGLSGTGGRQSQRKANYAPKPEPRNRKCETTLRNC
jgi:hypothetical protein